MTDTLVPSPPPSTPPHASGPKLALTGFGLFVLLASAVFGFDPYGVRERVLGSATAPPRAPAVSRAAGAGPPPTLGTSLPADRTVLRSQPWWQGVTTLSGTGPVTAAPFEIDRRAIQWRARWTCATGRLLVQVDVGARPVVDQPCPGSGAGYGTRTGAVRVQVTAGGPWELQIDQQVDLPLNEPPLPAMAAPGASAVATGDFYRIDQFGDGKVAVYRLADGSYALRLEDFYVTPNTDLEVQLSPLAAPRTTEQVAGARSASVATLDVTAGSMNFTVPPGIDPARYQSVVIWCERLFSAYAAATLRPVP